MEIKNLKAKITASALSLATLVGGVGAAVSEVHDFIDRISAEAVEAANTGPSMEDYLRSQVIVLSDSLKACQERTTSE